MNPDSANSTSSEEPAPASGHEPISVPEKLAYGLGVTNDIWGNWLYHSMAWPVFNIFLGVSPTLVSSALMANRLIDAVTDPLFGWLSDNARTRWGRRRPFILVGSVLAGILLPGLFFFVSPDWEQPTGAWHQNPYFWYMVVSSSLLICAVSCFNMAYQSLGAELTPDYHQRTSVFAYKNVIQRIIDLAMFGAAAFITLSYFNDPDTGEPDMLRGARVYTTVLGAVMIMIGVLVFACVKERYYGKVVAGRQGKVSVLASLGLALKCRPFRATLVMNLAYGLGTCMVGALGYYLTVYYVCHGDVALGSKWSFGMGFANMGGALLGVPLAAGVARHLDKRLALTLILLAGILIYVASWWLYNPAIPVLQLAASGSIAFLSASFGMLLASIGADIVDYDELETGMRREGAFTACSSWITKLGGALGVGLTGFVLAATGFDADLKGAQSPETIQNMRVLFFAIPVGGLLVALIALTRLGLTEQGMVEIRAKLESRRGEV